MALLNKGIKLSADQTKILLNNRLFETAAGTSFITLKPDVAAADGIVTLLDPGSTTAGYLKISLRYLNTGTSTAGYSYIIETLGTNSQTIESEKIDYGLESTLGVTYDATTGKISYYISGKDSIVNSPLNITAFTAGVIPVASGLALSTTTDTPASLGLGKYNGYLSKIATFSSVFSADDLKKYVTDPSVLPVKDQLILLDATLLASVDRIDTSSPEIQKLTFGAALASGVITVDGVRTVVMAGDMGSVIAEKVKNTLIESSLFKPQLEKQKITFSENTVGTTFKVAGVSVTVGATDSAATIATAVTTALASNVFITGTAGRSVQDNGDGSLVVTFANTDGDAKSISVDSALTTIKASVDTTQTYNATGNGRKVVVDGASVLISMNAADLNPKDLIVTAGGTGVSITKPTTTANHTEEFTSFIPSAISFAGTPVGEIQRFILTTGADADGGTYTLSGSLGASVTSTFAVQANGYTLAQTASKIATDLNAVLGTLTNVESVTANGEYIDVKFKANAANVADITKADGAAPNASNLNGLLLTTQQYAQNLPGEAQVITFTNATTASTLTVDGISVSIAATDTASAIATKVQTALINDGTNGSGKYSAPEVQVITFLSGVTGAGNITVNGLAVALLVGDTTPASVATKVSSALNLVAGKNYTAAVDGDSVRVTFNNAARDATTMTALVPAIGVTATAFTTVREFDANGLRATKVNSDGTLSIEFSPSEGNVAPVIFADAASGVTASVATAREAFALKLSSSSYTGVTAAPTDGSVSASNVLYAELVSTESAYGRSATKKLVFDVFIDPTAKAKVGDSYDSIGFTLNYSQTDFLASSARIEMGTSATGSSTFNTGTPGQIIVRALESVAITDFSKRVARITIDQQPSAGAYKESLDLTFSSVDIDGVDYTSGITNTRTFVDTINTDRWDIKQKLVNGLDGTTAIGGQLVGYYGSPTVSNAQLVLQYSAFKDQGAATTTLTNLNKTLGIEVISNTAAVKTAKFSIELPSDALNFKFELSAQSIAAGLKLASGSGVVQGAQGRSYVVQLDGGNVAGLAKGATIGTLSVDLINGKDKTHEFMFSPGVNSLNGAAVTSQNLYFGYTSTATADDSLTGLKKGEWLAKDMPKGDFSKFFVDTAPTLASKVITAADALQILKLSAGFPLEWKGAGTTPDGAFTAADLDGSGKVTSADALIALKYATGIIPSSDPVKWKFYDSTTANLSVESSKIAAALKAGMVVGTTADVLEITNANNYKDYFVQAILVGNVTNPALEL